MANRFEKFTWGECNAMEVALRMNKKEGCPFAARLLKELAQEKDSIEEEWKEKLR